MKTSWTQGLSKEKAEIVMSDFKGSLALRMRLADMLSAKQSTNRREGRSKEAYSNANWAYLQADAVGYERALSEVISLILEKNVE